MVRDCILMGEEVMICIYLILIVAVAFLSGLLGR